MRYDFAIITIEVMMKRLNDEDSIDAKKKNEKNGVDVVSVFFKSKVHMCPNICVHFN
jgi:hypothetical protein